MYLYQVWSCVGPYVSLMSPEIVTYEQLAIFYSLTPVISTFGPIFVGNMLCVMLNSQFKKKLIS